MPQNITDVDEFTDPVQVPEDGEAATGASQLLGAQDLSNRTRNLKNRVDAHEARLDEIDAANAFGRYAVSGTPASGAKFTLTEVAANELTVASNEVTIVTAGLYLISLHCSLARNVTDDGAGTEDGAYVAAGIYADAVEVANGTARRFNTEVDISVMVVCTVVLALAAGQKISVKASMADLSTPPTGDTNRLLSIGRLA